MPQLSPHYWMIRGLYWQHLTLEWAGQGGGCCLGNGICVGLFSAESRQHFIRPGTTFEQSCLSYKKISSRMAGRGSAI